MPRSEVAVLGPSGNPIDADVAQQALVTPRPPAFGAGGAYEVAAVTGNIAATLAAGSTLFSMRWTSATLLALIEYIEVSAFVTGAITAGVLFDLEAVIARAFTVADSGGTALTLTGNNQKLRASMASSLAAMNLATVGALTVGTRTPDAQAIGRVQAFTGTAVNTQFLGTPLGRATLYRRGLSAKHPPLLVQNEGLLIRNPLAGPATGTFNVLVAIGLMEIPAF